MDVTYADLIIGRRIGKGACSAVHVAEHDKSGELYAVKMFNAFDKLQAIVVNMKTNMLSLLSIQVDYIDADGD